MKRWCLWIVTLSAVTLVCALAWGQDVERECPICARAMQAEWRFCPYDGTSLVQTPLGPSDDEPQEVLLKFFQAYHDGDAQGIAGTLDLEGIVAGVIRKGVDEIEAEGVRSVLARDFADQAARAIVPVILGVLTCDEMRQQYPIPEEFLHPKAISAVYRTEKSPGKARLVPLRALGSPVVLRKRHDRWMIAEFPVMPR